MKKTLQFLVLILCLSATKTIMAQDDLLSILGPEEETTQYANASFKTNKIINLHSIENTAPGVLDFKIAHRFGFINGGAYEFFGLDQASMKLIFDYGITKNLQVGFGRTNFENFTLQLTPSLLHRNLVESTAVENDVYSIAIAGRQKLTKRMAINVEYIYNPNGQIDPKYFNSLSVGFDIEQKEIFILVLI